MPNKAEAHEESDEELEMVGSTLEDTVYATPTQPTPRRKNGGRVPSGDTCLKVPIQKQRQQKG